MAHAKGYDETFEPAELQSTHWYNAGKGRGGWTANFLYAAPSEVARVGLHDCRELDCPVKHAGSREEWEKN